MRFWDLQAVTAMVTGWAEATDGEQTGPLVPQCCRAADAAGARPADSTERDPRAGPRKLGADGLTGPVCSRFV